MPKVEQENELIFKIEQDSHVMYSNLPHKLLEAASVPHLRSIQRNLLAAFLDVEKKVQEKVFKAGNASTCFVELTNGREEWPTLMLPDEQECESSQGAQGAEMAVIAAIAKGIDLCDNEFEIRAPNLDDEDDSERVAYFLERLQEQVNPSDPQDE